MRRRGPGLRRETGNRGRHRETGAAHDRANAQWAAGRPNRNDRDHLSVSYICKISQGRRGIVEGEIGRRAKAGAVDRYHSAGLAKGGRKAGDRGCRGVAAKQRQKYSRRYLQKNSDTPYFGRCHLPSTHNCFAQIHERPTSPLHPQWYGLLRIRASQFASRPFAKTLFAGAPL